MNEIVLFAICVIVILALIIFMWKDEKKTVAPIKAFPVPSCFFCKTKFLHWERARLEKDNKLACLPCAEKQGWCMPFKEGFLIEKGVVFAKCDEELHPGDFVQVDTQGKSIPEWAKEMQRRASIPPTDGWPVVTTLLSDTDKLGTLNGHSLDEWGEILPGEFVPVNKPVVPVKLKLTGKAKTKGKK